MNYLQELERQISNLIEKEYPKHSGLTNEEFTKLFHAIKNSITNADIPELDIENGILPFVVVIKRELVDLKTQMHLVRYNEKAGVDIMRPHEPEEFKTIDTVTIPESQVYLITNIDRGDKYLNIIPESALTSIIGENRSPLTIEEGIALVTQYPEALIKNKCFSLPGSRINGNQRVPAVWINGKKEANLGWCWDRNPHTWLGSASCEKRI
jgi:hypothetical protein